MGRLSSGLRLNSSSDDASGMSVAESLDVTRRSLKVAERNANEGVTLVQVAESATSDVGNMVKRMRELAVQSSSDSLADTERAYVQDEYTALASEVDRIAANTAYSGIQLTDGSNGTLDIQVGVSGTASDRMQVTLGDLSTATLGVDTATNDLSTSAGAQAAIDSFDTALDTLNSYRSDYGSVQGRLGAAAANITTYHQNLTDTESRIRDADFATEAADVARFQIMQNANVAMLGQANRLGQRAPMLIG